MNIIQEWKEKINASKLKEEALKKVAEAEQLLKMKKDENVKEGYDTVMKILSQMKSSKMIDDKTYVMLSNCADNEYFNCGAVHRSYPVSTYDFIDSIMKELNNPNYKFIKVEDAVRNAETNHILQLLSHSKHGIYVVSQEYTYVIIPDYKKLLLGAKPILEKQKAELIKELDDFKTEHKADFELLERIKQATKIVKSDWHNLYHRNDRMILSKGFLLNFIDEETKKL